MQRLVAVSVLSWLSLACQNDELGPLASPATDHPAYAAEYPARLEGVATRSEIEHGWAKEFPSEFESFPDALDEPDWELIAHVYELAESDGRSAHYAQVRRENVEVAAFFVQEKKDLVAKVSGGVHYQAEKDGCDTKFYGAIDRGLEKGVEESFEEREQDSSRAQRFISRYQQHIGKDNAAILEKQAKTISGAAYLAYIALAQRHQELTEMLDERDAVRKTIERRLEHLKSSSPPEEDPKAEEALAEEISRFEQARAQLDGAVEAGRNRLETSEENVLAARAAFDEAFRALLDDVEARAKDGPAPAAD